MKKIFLAYGIAGLMMLGSCGSKSSDSSSSDESSSKMEQDDDMDDYSSYLNDKDDDDDDMDMEPVEGIEVIDIESISDALPEMPDMDDVVNAASKASSVATTSDAEFDALMKSYEEYIDEYIAVMKKVKNGDVTALSQSTGVMQKAQEYGEKITKLSGTLTSSQLAKFQKLQQKLLTAASSM